MEIATLFLALGVLGLYGAPFYSILYLRVSVSSRRAVRRA